MDDLIEIKELLSGNQDSTNAPPPSHPLTDFEAYTPELKLALTGTERLVGSALAGDPPRWLSLLGVQGTGKTHLAKAATDAMRGRGQRAQMWRWSSIMDRLRSGQWDLKDQLFRIPFLAIDDLGAGHDTAFSQAFADELADKRLGKWTIWTSNLTYQQIGDGLSWRVHSRMMRGGSAVVEILETQDFSQR